MKRMRGKTLGKRRTPNGITKEEVKREVAKSMFRGSNHSAGKFAEELMARSNAGIDVGYLRTLLFPELYNADVPQPLSTQSYCRFTDKKEWTISSATQGMLIWFPKVTQGP